MTLDYRALIIDDEKDICDLIEMSFLSIGIESHKAYSVSDAIVALQKEEFDVCFTDLKLPDGDGFDIIQFIQTNQPTLPVAMMTAHGNVESAIEALKMGAFDFISKPFEVDHLRKLAKDAIKTKETSSGEARHHNMFGDSKPMQQVREMICRLAHSQAPVYINGESGTGKELAARAIHNESSREEGPFIAVNCGAIPEQLVESEFFGHKKGSFTGADRDKVGLFQAADGGSIFLDEVADLPMDMQVKLLRTIQERSVRPVGGTEEIEINVRIISASHRHLEQLVIDKEFRQDLFYRLNVITLELPPLRERLEDIPILCEHLLKRINEANGTHLSISSEATLALKKYNFPGNVRELENILERACAFAIGDTITPDDLHLNGNNLLQNQIIDEERNTQNRLTDQTNDQTTHHSSSTSDPANNGSETSVNNNDAVENLPDDGTIRIPQEVDDIEGYLSQVEEKIIRQALENNRNKTEAAKSLGISFRQFRYRLKKLKIEDD